MAEQFDKITEPQEWIDNLLKIYAPNSEDIDVALQNMGLKIKEQEFQIKMLSVKFRTLKPMIDLPVEFSKMIDDNFWDLV